MLHESFCHEKNTFLTLTYDEAHLPENGSLSLETLQKFMKRLRKSALPNKIRYYGCGEYGELKGRPHYHLIIFGLGLDHDYKKSWDLGQIHIGSVTLQSCRYTADYIQKSIKGPKAEEFYGELEPPFQVYSIGLGRDWAKANKELYSADLYLTVDGRKKPLPKYYKKILNIDKTKLKRLYYENENKVFLHHRERGRRTFWEIKFAREENRNQHDLTLMARSYVRDGPNI